MKNLFVEKGQIANDLSSIKDKKLVLFPAGQYTSLLLQFHKLDNISYICDNSNSAQGTTIHNVPVVSPQKLAEETDDLCIIVTSPKLAPEFSKQLSVLNILARYELIVCQWGSITPRKFYDPFAFEDRRKNYGKALFVLAGYKEKLWDIVFKRIARFTPRGIDVCVMSSGKYVEKLSKICANHDWSYLSTSVNRVPLIQNIAINLHPEAEYIYKLDEDIFICEGFFDDLMKTYVEVEHLSRFHVGIVAPMIPVNPHGNVRFLEKTSCLNEYEAKFGKAYYDFNTHFKMKTQETLFLWEHTLPLDDTAKKIRKMPFSYFICPHRFSIGAILFKRTVWEEMSGFNVREGTGWGGDEYDFAVHFLARPNFYTYIMAENVLAGHYSFGELDRPALLDEFYEQNKEQFDIMED